MFLTLDGGVFTCGTSEYGQTGHGTTRDELVPRKVRSRNYFSQDFYVVLRSRVLVFVPVG